MSQTIIFDEATVEAGMAGKKGRKRRQRRRQRRKDRRARRRERRQERKDRVLDIAAAQFEAQNDILADMYAPDEDGQYEGVVYGADVATGTHRGDPRLTGATGQPPVPYPGTAAPAPAFPTPVVLAIGGGALVLVLALTMSGKKKGGK